MQNYIPIPLETAKFMARIKDEIETMATEKSAGIARTISSFSQEAIVSRSRLAEARKSQLQVGWV